MDDPVIIAVVGGIAPTLAIIVGTVCNLFLLNRADKRAADIAKKLVISTVENNNKLDHINETTSQTHTIVNSQRTAMERIIEELRNEITVLKIALAKKVDLN